MSQKTSRRKFLAAATGAIAMAAGGVVSTCVAEDDKDFVDQNGIHIYKDPKKAPIPMDAPSADFQVISLYGYKLVEVTDKKTDKKKKYWMAGTETDYRAAEAKRLKIKPEDVKPRKEQEILDSCHQTGPQSCSGFCTSGFCSLAYNPSGHFYYCGCF